jgi:hypothetical protein
VSPESLLQQTSLFEPGFEIKYQVRDVALACGGYEVGIAEAPGQSFSVD